MRLWLSVLVLVCVLVVADFAQESPKSQIDEATIHIVAVDGFGRELGEVKIDSFRDELHGRQLASRFRENTATKVPFGAYDLKLHQVGFFNAERRVYVFKPEVWSVVGLAAGEELPASPSARYPLSGTVKNIDRGDEPMYVRLVGLYSDYLIDDRVDVHGLSGTFTLAGLASQGKYLLVTNGRRHVLDIRQIEIPLKEPIVIDLGTPSNK